METASVEFDPAEFLETVAKGRVIATHSEKEQIFAQGDKADTVFYIRSGKKSLSYPMKARRPLSQS